MPITEGISIIIPVYNEIDCIGNLIRYLKVHSPANIEIIVSDGGSSDNTTTDAANEGALVVKSPKKGRAQQMNYGASFAKKNILYFVHADCFPPENYYSKIINAIDKGFDFGRFQTKFDSKKKLLKINAFFTRFDWFICSGGDQTLFIKQDVFNKLSGFSDMLIMEDYDIVERGKKKYRYAILNERVLVSARKYDNNSWLKVQKANSTIVKMYRKRIQQEVLITTYKQMLDYR